MSIALNDAPARSTFGAGFGARFARMVHALQKSRMRSVLYQMSDKELELIGVSRGEIEAYAEKLLQE